MVVSKSQCEFDTMLQLSQFFPLSSSYEKELLPIDIRNGFETLMTAHSKPLDFKRGNFSYRTSVKIYLKNLTYFTHN